jgi:hypothetical protein
VNCVVCTKARTAEAGLLCAGHHARLGQMLADIETEAALLSAVPSMQQRTGSGGGAPAFTRAPARLDPIVHNDPRSRPAGQRPPGPACDTCWHGSCIDIRAWIDAYDARTTDALSILDVLGSWASLVREERRLTVDGAASVTTEAGTLRFHLDWITEQPWCDEMFSDLRDLLGQLQAANGTRRETPIAKCSVPIDGDLCGGNVWQHDFPTEVWRIRRDRCELDKVRAPIGSAHCDRCWTTWEGAELARLLLIREQDYREARRPLTEDGRPMFTVEELAQRHRISTNAVRLKLSRARSRSFGGYYDPAPFDKATA